MILRRILSSQLVFKHTRDKINNEHTMMIASLSAVHYYASRYRDIFEQNLRSDEKSYLQKTIDLLLLV